LLYACPYVPICHNLPQSATFVTGYADGVGGLAGDADTVANCCADVIVTGYDGYVGGLAGHANTIMNCYAHGAVVGGEYAGGLAGHADSITNCYAAALVCGGLSAGGLVPPESYYYGDAVRVAASFWDVEASMQTTSAGGTGKTTADMRSLITFLAWGEGDNAGIWAIDDGNDYPRLAWENRPGMAIEPTPFSDLFAGTGTPDDSFLIYTAGQLDLIGQSPDQWDKHYKLMVDIDLTTYADAQFHRIGTWEHPFQGVFDSNGHAISNFTYTLDVNFTEAAEGDTNVGLFAHVQRKFCDRLDEACHQQESGIIRNIGLLEPYVNGGIYGDGGALVGHLDGGTIEKCYVEGGIVSTAKYMNGSVGGLVGHCSGSLTIAACYSSAVVVGFGGAGGLVGYSREATIRNCYATGAVIGECHVGGLVGYGYRGGSIENCYATGFVAALDSGGLFGYGPSGSVLAGFWDVETSGQDISAGGMGLTTAEMMTAAPFLEAGWDFVGEVENGVEDVWWIREGQDYPRLWWEATDVEF